MKPFDKLEENYFPKGIELLEYMESLAVQYVPDIDIDPSTGEKYICGTTALPIFIRRFNQNKLYGNFTYEDYIANENIQKTLKGLGIDGKIGVCCHSGLAERNAEYHVNFIFYRD